MTNKRKRGRGRPPKHAIEPIPDTFEEVMRAVVALWPAVLPPLDREEGEEAEEEQEPSEAE